MSTHFVLEHDQDIGPLTHQDNSTINKGSLSDWSRELQEIMGTNGRDSPELLHSALLGGLLGTQDLAAEEQPSAVANASNGARRANCSLPAASAEKITSTLPASSASPASSSVPLTRSSTPPPKSPAERRRGKMQQSIEKAGAKAEAILKKMVESGKLHPGSLGKQSQKAYKRLPAWLRLEAMRQLEWELGLLDSCLPHAAKIFKEILQDLKTHPPRQHRDLIRHKARQRRPARTKWESGSYMSLTDDASISDKGTKAVASEGSAPNMAGKAGSAAATLAGAAAQSASTSRDAASLSGSLLEPHLARAMPLDMSQTSSGVLTVMLGQQHRADGSSSGIDPEAHCFLVSTLYQALRGESPRNDGDCDSSSSASGLSSVSGLSAEAECVFDSGLDEVAPPESSSESSPPAFQLEGMAARSERTAGGAQYPKASRGSTTTELPSSVPASGAAGRLTACSAGAACSAAGQPAVGQAVLPGLPVQAASVLPEASSARLLEFCRRITDATSRSQFLSETLSAPVPDASASCMRSVQLRQNEPTSSPQLANGIASLGPHTSEQACAPILRQLPASLLSMMPHQTLPSLLSLSPPSLPAGGSAERSAQSTRVLPSSIRSNLQHSMHTAVDAMLSRTGVIHDRSEWPFSPAGVLSSQASQDIYGGSRVSAVEGESTSGKACASVMPWLSPQPEDAPAQPNLAQPQPSRAPHTPEKADKRPSSSRSKTPLQPAAKYTAGRLANGAPANTGMPGGSSKLQHGKCCVQALLVGSAALQPERNANRSTCSPPRASTLDYMALMGLASQAHTAEEAQGSQAWSELVASWRESTAGVLREAPSRAVARGSPAYPAQIAQQSADRLDSQSKEQPDDSMELLNLLKGQAALLDTRTGHAACSPHMDAQSADVLCASSAGSANTRSSEQPDAGMQLLELLKPGREMMGVPASCPSAQCTAGSDRAATPVQNRAVAGDTSGASRPAQPSAATATGSVLSQLLSGRGLEVGIPEKQTVAVQPSRASQASAAPYPAIAIPWASIPQAQRSSKGQGSPTIRTTSGAGRSTSGPHREWACSSAANSNHDFLAFLAGS